MNHCHQPTTIIAAVGGKRSTYSEPSLTTLAFVTQPCLSASEQARPRRGRTPNKREEIIIDVFFKKLWKTSRRCVIALHFYTLYIRRVKLRDIHYLPLVNEDPRWGRCRLCRGDARLTKMKKKKRKLSQRLNLYFNLRKSSQYLSA